jgi:hypothetical protein
LVRVEQLQPAAEPRLQGGEFDESISADHPFFWAGYMLVDTGSLPEKQEIPIEVDGKLPPVPAPVGEATTTEDDVPGEDAADDVTEDEAVDAESDLPASDSADTTPGSPTADRRPSDIGVE